MLLWTLALTFAMDVRSDNVRSGAVRDRVVDDDADLVLFYVSEHHGNMDTCGCDANPRGGFPRLAGYLGAVERKGRGTPSLLLHAGDWASTSFDTNGELTSDARVQNRRMIEGMDLLGFDAINLGSRDSIWIRDAPVPELAVAANAPDVVPDVRYVQAGQHTVAIVGVSAPGSEMLQPEGFDWPDPVPVIEAGLEEWTERADLVVVLAYDPRSAAESIARIDGVDVLIETGAFIGRDEPWTDEDTIWVRSRDRGQSVGELRLWLDDDGISAAFDRWVSLDEELPEAGPVRRHVRRTNRERAKALGGYPAP